jgi:hypothetical protein
VAGGGAHPVCSSWINQVERWFAELHPPTDRTWRPPQRETLEKDIRAWVANWNDNPKPFVWAKTAEQILQSL